MDMVEMIASKERQFYYDCQQSNIKELELDIVLNEIRVVIDRMMNDYSMMFTYTIHDDFKSITALRSPEWWRIQKYVGYSMNHVTFAKMFAIYFSKNGKDNIDLLEYELNKVC